MINLIFILSLLPFLIGVVVVSDGSCCCGGLGCCEPPAHPIARVDVGSWAFEPDLLTTCGEECETWDDTIYAINMAVSGSACTGCIDGDLGICAGVGPPVQLHHRTCVWIDDLGGGLKQWRFQVVFTLAGSGTTTYVYISAPFPEDECREPRAMNFFAFGSSGGSPPCARPFDPARRPAVITVTPSLT